MPDKVNIFEPLRYQTIPELCRFFYPVRVSAARSRAFNRPQRHSHIVHHVPQVAAESFLKVLRKIPKRLSDVVLDLFNPEVGSNSVRRWWFKILKGILSDVPDVGRVPESPARGVVGDDDSHLGSRSTNSINLFHKSNEVSNMLDYVAQIHNVD